MEKITLAMIFATVAAAATVPSSLTSIFALWRAIERKTDSSVRLLYSSEAAVKTWPKLLKDCFEVKFGLDGEFWHLEADFSCASHATKDFFEF